MSNTFYVLPVPSRYKEIHGCDYDSSVFSKGDYLQAALCNMELDIFISNLIVASAGPDAAPDAPEPDGISAMVLLNSLRTQEFGERYRRVGIDVSEAIVTALWHQNWGQPLIEGDTFIRFEKILKLHDRLKSFDIDARRKFATKILAKWDELFDVFWAAKEHADTEELEKREIEAKEKAKERKKKAKDVGRGWEGMSEVFFGNFGEDCLLLSRQAFVLGQFSGLGKLN